MNEIIFQLNDKTVEAHEINTLYTLIGWNNSNQRTEDRTVSILETSAAYATARSGGELIGFGRMLGDAYTAQLLDVMTTPAFRKHGVATQIIQLLLDWSGNRFLGIYLIDGARNPTFYERLGFEAADPETDRLMYWQPQL
ncbi:hypothetical protein GCM10022631_38120 [Deinococcus rubellus]|uniref:GNAT family N-acetyltransferase n=1 Tax=Deinococcus rubellus TaxID=1889240 RepID=A0ABY5YGE1_9DEIO|nr:GNAT family N-acetyltransferase [Deinococcus rubellus]UWX63162.1 GNAT family N-acetyltransferase [Deinococcus rubellus]